MFLDLIIRKITHFICLFLTFSVTLGPLLSSALTMVNAATRHKHKNNFIFGYSLVICTSGAITFRVQCKLTNVKCFVSFYIGDVDFQPDSLGYLSNR